MTTTEIPTLTAPDRLTVDKALAATGEYTHTSGTDTVKVFYVAGGSFCRTERRTGRALIEGRTHRLSSHAVNHFLALVKELS